MAQGQTFTQKEYALFLHRIRGHDGQRPSRPVAKQEGTGYRDMALSQLHREWGYDVPACDIDFLEYDESRPVALVEYKMRKNWDTEEVKRDANLRALILLGNRARLPVFCTFYAPDHSMFRVIPLNTYAIASQMAMFAF